MKFTDKLLLSLQPQAKPYDLLEGDGFTLRVHPTGKKVFRYVFKMGGKNQAITIGPYPAISLKQAREQHRNYLTMRGRGENPKHHRSSFTVADLVKDYLEKWAKPRKKSWKEDERILQKDVVPVLGDLPADEVQKRDILRLLEKIAKRGENAAFQTFKILRRMFAFAMERDLLSATPCASIKTPGGERRKDRVLSEEEIKAVWAALAVSKVALETQCALKLVLATGQRPGECLGMEWSEVDGDWWTIPREKAKNGREHRVFLSPLAKELMGKRRKGYVFPSLRSKKGKPSRVTALSFALRRLREEDRENRLVVEFTPHDLRRTAATGIAELGFSDFVVGRVLNHTERTVTSIYNRYSYDEEKKQALTAWGEKLAKMLTPSP